jgi:hypothetical protein
MTPGLLDSDTGTSILALADRASGSMTVEMPAGMPLLEGLILIASVSRSGQQSVGGSGFLKYRQSVLLTVLA